MEGFSSFVALLDDLGTAGLALSIVAATSATLLAAVVGLLNIALRRWLSAGVMSLLWGIVILRLLVPLAPSSTISLQNLWRVASSNYAHQPPANSLLSTEADALASAPADVAVAAHVATPVTGEAPGNANEPTPLLDLLGILLPATWLIGLAMLLTATLVANWRFHRLLGLASLCSDRQVNSLWDDCRRLVRCRRSIPLLHVDALDHVAIAGLWRPKLLLPAIARELTEEELRMVMLHELGHVRRWDIAANWLLAIVRAAHWWNPIFWLAAARFRALREQACDAFALAHLEGRPARAYSELLLKLLSRPSVQPRWRIMLPASIVGFLSGILRRRMAHNRLRALRTAAVSRRRWQVASAATVVSLVAIAGLTDAAAPPEKRTPESSWLPGAAYDWDVWVAPKPHLGPEVTRDYDLAQLWKRVDTDPPMCDIARKNVYWLLVHVLRASTGHYYEQTNEWAAERVKIDGDSLTIIAPAAVHDEIRRLLSAWEKSGVGQTCIETCFLTCDEDIAARLGVQWRYVEPPPPADDRAFAEWREEKFSARATVSIDDYLATAVATLDREGAAALITICNNVAGQPLHAPKVTAFNGQQIFLMDIEQSAYLGGLERLAGGIQQPKIVVVDEGVKVKMRTLQSADAKTVDVSGNIELTKIEEVRKVTAETPDGPQTLEIPRVRRCRIDVSSTLPDGQSLLIGCIPTYEQKQFLYVLLTPRVVVEGDGLTEAKTTE